MGEGFKHRTIKLQLAPFQAPIFKPEKLKIIPGENDVLEIAFQAFFFAISVFVLQGNNHSHPVINGTVTTTCS